MAVPGNVNAQKYGAEAAIKRVQDGAAFTGLAVAQEQAVTSDLEALGCPALIKRNAIRAQVVLELYWTAVQTAADSGDLAKLDAYAARWGWLCGVAGRALAEVERHSKGKGKTMDAILGKVKDG